MNIPGGKSPLNFAATLMAERQHCSYSSVKLDSDILPSVKAAAALSRQSIQDWLSDLANEAAAKRLGSKPIKRLPPPPPKKPK
jgi:hypothetical protein